MKRILIVAAIASICLTSCKEKGPFVILTASAARDTTYTDAVETPQSHNVLVEECTGATCPNCPSGHAILNNLSASNPGRINIMALHVTNFPQAKPVAGSTYDFRTTLGTDIVNQFYGSIIGEPSAGIDRTAYGGTTLPFYDAWPSAIGARLAVPNTINLYVQSNYDAATRIASIQAKIAYTAIDTLQEFLSLAIVEDTMYDKQDSLGNITLDHYLFNNIFRTLVTPLIGDQVLPTMAVKSPGRVDLLNYTDTLDASWNPKHCRVIAFVARNGANMQVLQSAQAKISP